MPPPTLSVVTLTWNRRDDLAESLASVRTQSVPPDEIIVVDNASSDGTAEILTRDFPEVRVLRLARNIGIAGYNRGAARARGDLVVFLDNDMTLATAEALSGVVRAFAGNDRLGCAALGVDDAHTGAVSENNPKYDDREGDEDTGFPTSVFDGGAVAFRRKALAQTGGYPEDFFIYHNEMALATELADAGWDVRYFPHLRAQHKASSAARPEGLWLRLWHRNYLWYCWRYLPARLALKETIAFLAVGVVRHGATRALPTLAAAVAEALAHLPRILSTRRPVRPEVAERMRRIRIRDHCRKHGIVDPAALARGRLGRAFWTWYYSDAH